MGFCGKILGSIRSAYTQRRAAKAAYKEYKTIIKDWNRQMNQTACTTIDITPVTRKIAQANGFSKETLETLQTTEFIEKFHELLASKGYKLPKTLTFYEPFLPRHSHLAGQNFNKHILYNPRCIEGLDLRIPIHETGHLLTPGINVIGANLKGGIDNNMYMIGQKLKKIPFIRKFFEKHTYCHLSKKEQLALTEDLKRAYKEGYFRHNPLSVRTKETAEYYEAAGKHDIARKVTRENNKIAKDFRKNPEEYYLPNSQLNRYEFIADIFNLKAQGFKFSPEVEAAYKRYKGPEIGDIITQKDMDNLEKLRKNILKKTLSDYGYSMFS